VNVSFSTTNIVIEFTESCVSDNIRESLKKADKIKEIESMLRDIEAVIDAVEKIGFHITARKYRRVLLILYNTVMISSRAEFNKKSRITV
jgi:hypothetical protein